MDLLQLLTGAMTQDQSVDALSKKSGLSGKQVALLVAAALPILIKFLTKNAASQQGAQSLASALEQHQTNLPTAQVIQDGDMDDGDKILEHILGGSKPQVMNDLSQQTGISTSQVSTLLSSMAPALLSGLSAATAAAAKPSKPSKPAVDLSDGIDLTDVMGLLSSGSGSSSSGTAGLLGSLLGGGKPSKPAVDLSDGIGLDDVMGILGSAGKPAQSNSSTNGTELLSSLLSLMK